MSANTAQNQWAELAGQARALAVATGEDATAEGLREVVQQVYNVTKFDRPGGEGPDGKDGPERRGMNPIVDAAEAHFFDTMHRARRV